VDDESLRGGSPVALIGQERNNGTRRVSVAVSFLLLVSLLLGLCGCGTKTDKAGVTVIVLDIGQGDAVLIRAPKGDILVDAGGEAMQTLLCSRLRQLGVRELALAVFTSADADRIGGADGVIEDIPVREIWFNGSFDANESAELLGRAIEQGQISLSRTDSNSRMQLGELTLGVLYPIVEDDREDGMVLYLNYGKGRALLMGDATEEQEKALCGTYPKTALRSELLLVGQHGSGNATTARLLDAVEPRYAVISCGAKNPFGYPVGETLARLESAQAQVLRTDRLGDIVIRSDGDEFYVPDGGTAEK